MKKMMSEEDERRDQEIGTLTASETVGETSIASSFDGAPGTSETTTTPKSPEPTRSANDNSFLAAARGGQ